MCAIAAVALMCALIKPFTASQPPSDAVIHVSFDIVKTKGPDGAEVLGGQPKYTVTKRAVAGAKPR
jgi:hypothetical protein